MGLPHVILRGGSQTHKDLGHMLLLLCGIWVEEAKEGHRRAGTGVGERADMERERV